MKKIRIFCPAFNVVKTIGQLIGELADVEKILSAKGYDFLCLVIDDASNDGTASLLEDVKKEHPWLRVLNNAINVGNAGNIVLGYRWGVCEKAHIVGCLDADGEHSPYAMIRHIRMIDNGECDGIVGSIIFPEIDGCKNTNDRNMMRFWGGLQSTMAGVDGVFYIQSPGYNLHKGYLAEKALDLFGKYVEFFQENAGRDKDGSSIPIPKWGMHGVFIHILSRGAGSHIKAVYLECFGESPNRTQEKLLQQASAANLHCIMLQKFFSN